ncbi:aldo/keto reductase [Paraburkholderia youngii]|uniref:aldo/keto reductase n=1 Tax=Paraburkholderia youngii TaxID=2782701 RepID=UPI003D2433E7
MHGGWQLASGHCTTRSKDPVADLVAFADAGITTFDCADIYTGVEELIGHFRKRYRDLRGEQALARINCEFASTDRWSAVSAARLRPLGRGCCVAMG